ncbi:MAG: hypothetical protein ACM34K_13220 [Bacillota bacterium]
MKEIIKKIIIELKATIFTGTSIIEIAWIIMIAHLFSWLWKDNSKEFFLKMTLFLAIYWEILDIKRKQNKLLKRLEDENKL